MLKGIDINQRIEFASKLDKEETKTTFMLKPLSGMDMLNVKSIETLLGLAVIEIQNPAISDKEEIVKYLNTLSSGVLAELIDEINKINKVTDDEQKN